MFARYNTFLISAHCTEHYVSSGSNITVIQTNPSKQACEACVCQRAESKKEDVADVWESHFLFLCSTIWGPSEAVVSGPFSQSVIWGEPDSSRQNRKGRQQLLENAPSPDFNLRASQSALPVEHSVTPCQLSDHTAPVHCCTSASHHKSNGRCDSNTRQTNCTLIFLMYSCYTLC